jgi:pyruvate dehydrogenase E1 component alpha subunit
VLLHIKTYRYKGHSMSDPGKYRSKQEVDGMKLLDPIELVKSMIYENNFATEQEIKIIDQQIKEIMQETVEFAKNSPEPDNIELYTDILL